MKRRDADEVRALLADTLDVNAREGDGATALHWAVSADDAVLVDLLLAAGADKVSVCSAALTRPELVSELAELLEAPVLATIPDDAFPPAPVIQSDAYDLQRALSALAGQPIRAVGLDESRSSLTRPP